MKGKKEKRYDKSIMSLIDNLVEDNLVDSDMNGLISDLQTLVKVPSVSAKKQGLVECAGHLADIKNKAGIKAEVLYLDPDNSPNEFTGIDLLNKTTKCIGCIIEKMTQP
jgi:hypothetical protein